MALKKGQQENDNFRRCTQTKCDFFIDGGCKPCESCNSQPFVLNKSCSRCLRCESVPMALRWDDDKINKLKEQISQKTDGQHKRVIVLVGGIEDNN